MLDLPSPALRFASFLATFCVSVCLPCNRTWAAEPPAKVAPATQTAALEAMKRATVFMTEKVAMHGGYVWSYLPDLSRRWGEVEARGQMIWVQSPGTIQMGHLFLDAYHATGDEFYYQAAGQVVGALREGQLACGGWHYLIDFAGEEDLRDWYATTGKNAWRLEEYQHYYGNATFDDSSTADATEYLLRFYLEKRDAKTKAALDRAIQFVLAAQYPSGGWPQRFPRTDDFHHHGLPDYTGHITFNDNVTGGNVDLLIQCYAALDDQSLLDPIHRGMDVFLATQGPAPQAGWSLQHSVDLKPAGARTYEPKALATHTTASNIAALIKFYRLTGEAKYLARIPEAFAWLESVKLPPDIRPSNGGTHPTFVELETNQPLFIHRQGSNGINGRYYVDHDWHNTVGHYSSFRFIDVADLRARYEEAKALPPERATADSPLLHPKAAKVFPPFFTRNDGGRFAGNFRGRGSETGGDRVAQILASLDATGRWLTELRSTSHPYTHDGSKEVAPGDFSRTQVGDETDTSPFSSTEHVMGISTAAYIRNMNVLLGAVSPEK